MIAMHPVSKRNKIYIHIRIYVKQRENEQLRQKEQRTHNKHPTTKSNGQQGPGRILLHMICEAPVIG